MGESYDQWLKENSNGWVVVYIGRERTPKRLIFTNVTGPFDDKQSALTYAARMRRKYRSAVRRGDMLASDMVKVSVRPLWTIEKG